MPNQGHGAPDPSRSEWVEIYQRERQILRDELRMLKNCQISYFSLSVTSTGVLFGVAPLLDNGGLVYLAPLVVILPCWRVFFDKATSITRIVGYARVLERGIVGEPIHYVGWENALSRFRRWQERYEGAWHHFCGPPEPVGRGAWVRRRLARLGWCRTSHKYWLINFWTFGVLATLCLVLAVVTPLTMPAKDRHWGLVLPSTALGIGFVARSAWIVGPVLRDLTHGIYRYRSMVWAWDRVLAAERADANP